MDNQQFIDKIEELRHNTYSRITNIQKEICPMTESLYLDYRKDSVIGILQISGEKC